jgi:hypothetical protein
MNKWTTDELFTEVLSRTVADRPALNHIQAMIMRALLNDCDQKAEAGARAQSLQS